MVDFIKISVSYPDNDKLHRILTSGAFLYVEQETDPYTGEVVKEVYKYHNMRLKPYNGGFILKGSIHKLHNELIGNTRPEWTAKYNGFNGDRFTLSEVENVIKHLCKLLNVQAGGCVLQNIEIGLNNVIPFSAFDFLQGIQAHRNNFAPTIKHGRNYFEFGYSQYYLKLYNKGKQYGLYDEVVRVEVKVIKMQKLHNAGVPIHTLADLSTDNLEKAFEVLTSEFEKVVNIDNSLRANELTEKDLIRLNELRNPAFWQKMTRVQVQRAKEFLEELNTTFSDNQKGQIIRKMHHEKEAIFNNKITPKCYKITDPENTNKNGVMLQNYPLSKREDCNIENLDLEKMEVLSSEKMSLEDEEKRDKKTLIFEDKESKKNEVENLPKNGVEKVKKTCPVTGVELTHENEGAKYIRTATFLYLKEHDPERYILLCSYLLPRTGYKPVREKNIIMHLCKQVRNLYNNPNRGKKSKKPPLQKYFKNQLELF
ncbi:hypothetical protein [Capnocytophaga felis]|uniref:Uncharacterized protein n=1 Tax=Capnocytophaga felis TaxID=2267611 RepID=A0A5M4B6H5_9FLAO|nr:hypothetical protein [Capnocytophaga felis]GET45199.1 hypothetical protein RCZ01_05010 [Capnocytophaga felis]GET47637.1 hypothetical protein RCZ02_04680 [Capnocytophaga felis]